MPDTALPGLRTCSEFGPWDRAARVVIGEDLAAFDALTERHVADVGREQGDSGGPSPVPAGANGTQVTVHA